MTGTASPSMIGVDVGGTFTDVVAVRDGEILTTKVTTDYVESHRAVIRGAEELGADVQVFNHASTHGLNAIITRNLPKIGFLTTEGHRDMLDMARAHRPPEANTDPRWRRSFGDVSGPVVPRYLRRGIRERIDADGSIVVGLDEEQAREQIRVLKDCAVEGVAICLLNSYVDPTHERRLRDLVAEELGADIACSISYDVSPLAREYPRASTTVVDVLMKEIYGPYARKLEKGLADAGFRGELNFADCAATLAPIDVALERPARIVFSGPAAGTVACARLGDMIDEPNLLCVDIGGTSADISVVTNGKPFVNTTFELEHDLIVNTLSNEIVSVGAGGGSIVWVNRAGEIQVGPKSAGSDPGPACYGTGGTQPTTTDTFVMIGILDPHRFAAGRSTLDHDLAQHAFEQLATGATLAERVRFAYKMAINNVAEGVLDVVVKDGIDPREYSLVSFGAAGSMMLPQLLDVMHSQKRDRSAVPGSVLGARAGQRRPGALGQPDVVHRARAGRRADRRRAVQGHGGAHAGRTRRGRRRGDLRADLRRHAHRPGLGDAVRRGALR
ncbi:MAG: hydantoinase/oxoprolinase family protein [Gordonia sp. (in: high G+C Gram-positive bacteria)]|uniref:hydantoinase/oxoprolinase family protein n=1 Tax=Gordonia sp. (in: high G+C Gram-positive bacteria) TaxID=84139 RepID=UPI0039E54FDB